MISNLKAKLFFFFLVLDCLPVAHQQHPALVDPIEGCVAFVLIQLRATVAIEELPATILIVVRIAIPRPFEILKIGGFWLGCGLNEAHQVESKESH
uniref:Putative secreted protein n=1 Tax=Lutzomyia longipalpis TaxID=7200 RepID=A0A7G3ALL6_LUTLO